MKLTKIAQEIREIIRDKQLEYNLTFDEETHTYTMKDIEGNIRSDWYSVSKVLKFFYEEFDSYSISLKKANGNIFEQEKLLKEWGDAGTYSTQMGSRTHYILENRALELFKLNKNVRQPIYDCNEEQILKSDSMVYSGIKYLNLMKERGAELIDTEMVLGSPHLCYTGQPDKLWLIPNAEKTEYGVVITDWKTNKPKNFEVNRWTKSMYKPFNKYPNNALGHYYLQLPFYVKLFIKMLENTKYSNLKFYGGVVVLLKEDKTYKEYKVPKDIITTVMNLNIQDYLIINK
jgi:hypothetical protein